MSTELCVMLTCANGQVAPSVIAMMRNHPDFAVRVVGVAAGDRYAGYGHTCCDIFYEVPLGDAPGYWDALLDIIDRESVDLIFIGSDDEALAITAQVDDLFAMGCKAACSSYEVNMLSSNKFTLNQHLRQSGVACTQSLEAETVEDIAGGLAQLGYPEREVVIKPKVGRGSRGFRIVTERRDPYTAFLNADRTTITLAELQEVFVNHPDALSQYMFMEYLPGDKYSTDILVQKGKVVCAVTRNNGPAPKINPPTQMADIVFDEDVYDYAESVVNAVGHDYFVQVECGRDHDGALKLIETNIRLDATLPITAGLGFNYYHEMMRYARTGEFRKELPMRPKDEKQRRFYRYWQHDFLEVL